MYQSHRKCMDPTMYEGATGSVSDTQKVLGTISSARESPNLLLTHIECEGVTKQVMEPHGQKMHWKLLIQIKI